MHVTSEENLAQDIRELRRESKEGFATVDAKLEKLDTKFDARFDKLIFALFAAAVAIVVALIGFSVAALVAVL
jgi:hypothetical protein